MSAPFAPKPLAKRLAFEIGPVFLFFAMAQWQGIFVATAAFIAATIVTALVSWHKERRVPLVPLIGAGFAILFGGATLMLHDPLWIVLRPTIFNAIAAAVLFLAMQRGWLILQSALGRGLAIPVATWRILTWRAIAFFVLLACLNELVWRSFDLDAWIAFKTFAVPALNLGFLAFNWPLVSRREEGNDHRIPLVARA